MKNLPLLALASLLVMALSLPAAAFNDLEQEQYQRQLQKQYQAQQASARATANARAKGVGVGLAGANSGGNTIQNTVEGDDYPASSAYAPGLATVHPCMGSTSAGGQGMSFGFAFGTTWIDPDCVRSNRAAAVKDPVVAKEILCENEDTRAAYKRAGKPCLADVEEADNEDLKRARYYIDPKTKRIERVVLASVQPTRAVELETAVAPAEEVTE